MADRRENLQNRRQDDILVELNEARRRIEKLKNIRIQLAERLRVAEKQVTWFQARTRSAFRPPIPEQSDILPGTSSVDDYFICDDLDDNDEDFPPYEPQELIEILKSRNTTCPHEIAQEMELLAKYLARNKNLTKKARMDIIREVDNSRPIEKQIVFESTTWDQFIARFIQNKEEEEEERLPTLERLRRAAPRTNESLLKYAHRIQYLATGAGISDRRILKFIVDGIPHDPYVRGALHICSNFDELKGALIILDRMMRSKEFRRHPN